MALVLMVRPWGLLGKPLNVSRAAVMQAESTAQTATANGLAWMAWITVIALAIMWPMLMTHMPYGVVLGIDVLIAVLFAASLHFIMGPAGLHSFGHAAYFGIGAYTAALLVLREGLPTEQVLWMAPLTRPSPDPDSSSVRLGVLGRIFPDKVSDPARDSILELPAPSVSVSEPEI
jgi:branched-chain amino acid transport system permease protein